MHGQSFGRIMASASVRQGRLSTPDVSCHKLTADFDFDIDFGKDEQAVVRLRQRNTGYQGAWNVT